MPMKRLISRAMYHPLLALSTFYFIDLMHNVDYSVAGALLVLAAKCMSRVAALIHTFGHRRSTWATSGLWIGCPRMSDQVCRSRMLRKSHALTEET
jgi:hypothetical protein